MFAYLWKGCENGEDVVMNTDISSAKVYGYTRKPDRIVKLEEWYANNSTAYVENGNIILGYPPERKKEMLSKEKRYQRDRLLASSDVYMVEDFPISDKDRKLVKEYRKALRDLPENKDWPNVEFPEFPL